MKLPFRDGHGHDSLGGVALGDILEELCEGHQHVLLATPYLQFEARFLEHHFLELKLRVTVGRETVRHVLMPHPLRLRFSWGLRFHSVPTQILGYEQEEHQRILRVRSPEHLVPDEQRRAFRVQRVGHSSGAVSGGDGRIFRVSVENLSTLGAGLFALDSLSEEPLRPGHFLDVSLTLDQGPALNLHGRVCWVEGQSFGLAFHPPVADGALEQLTAWLEPRELETLERWENRAQLRAIADQAARPKKPPAGILLLSSNPVLKEQVTQVLGEIQSVRAVSPAMGPVQETRFQPPLLYLVDAGGADGEDRYRLRTLLEAIPLEAPVVVLGDGQDPAGVQQLSADLKAATQLDWNPQQDVFFRRLVRGLIRRHWKTELPEH
jgi:hypothetical protein